MKESITMKWVTRESVRVDRVSSSWLILGFADPEAEILYVPGDQVLEVAERENAIPFDIPGVEMGHHGEKCSFEAILEKYGPKDPALERVGMIVRGADTKDKDATPESRGLDALANGFKKMMLAEGYDDRESIRRQWRMYNAFYVFCGGDPAKAPEPK